MTKNFEDGAKTEITKNGMSVKLVEMAIEDRIEKLLRDGPPTGDLAASAVLGGVQELERLLDFIQDDIWEKLLASGALTPDTEVLH
jgi:hypothetical protein